MINSNTYSFSYPEHWLNYNPAINNSEKAFGLRAITITPAARDMYLHGIRLQRDNISPAVFDVDMSFRISLGNDDNMNAFNTKINDSINTTVKTYLEDIRQERATSAAPTAIESYLNYTDYSIYYSHDEHALILYANASLSSHPFYLTFENIESYASDDFKKVVGVDVDTLFKQLYQLQTGTITKANLSIPSTVDISYITDDENDTRINKIVFRNIWDRSRVLIASDISSLSEGRYLTLSSIRHSPPKLYSLTGFKEAFNIYLYTPTGEEIELPNDNKDTITIEAILIAK